MQSKTTDNTAPTKNYSTPAIPPTPGSKTTVELRESRQPLRLAAFFYTVKHRQATVKTATFRRSIRNINAPLNSVFLYHRLPNGADNLALANTETKQAKPRVKEYNLVDGNSLRLRVKPNGSRLWLLNYYRPHTKKCAYLSLGTYASVSLAATRKAILKAWRLSAQEVDPAERRRRLAIIAGDALQTSFQQVATDCFEIHRSKAFDNHA
ncbi:integrase arm-type DNA-binding domain-containing protein [Microbulbifer sp. SA54]|uniref:integrase arm-type DNA-binding domain-containing protein n=1 Tax=Microbulbifer sp. SA54 TaxID=3401577 RepID=UPI003AAC5F55